MESKTKFKVDLDIKVKNKTIDFLVERINYLIWFNIFSLQDIEKIELIHKNTYSCKIHYKREVLSPEIQIIIQSVLGDDFKRTMICLRDYNLGINNWNRLFDVKKNVSGDYVFGKTTDVTKTIFDKLTLSENDKRI